MAANELLALSGPLQLSEDETVVDVLVDRMDRAAVRFLSLMDDDSRDPESGQLLVDLKTRVEVFKMVREWIVSRHRADVGDENANPGKGFEDYKAQRPSQPQGPGGKFVKRTPEDGEPAAAPAGKSAQKKPAPRKGASGPINQQKPKFGEASSNLMDRMKGLGFPVDQGN